MTLFIAGPDISMMKRKDHYSTMKVFTFQTQLINTV